MERSNREIALQWAINFTQGTYDENIMVDHEFGGQSAKYTPPTIEQQLQNAEKYLAFLEADEVTE
jgi:hypothetical protein